MRMNYWKFIIFGYLALFLFGSGLIVNGKTAPGANSDAAIVTPRMIDEIESIISAYREAGWFSGNVLISASNVTRFEESYGLADQEAGMKNTSETLFHLGSIAKNFTAVLVLQMVEAGKLSLENTLEAFDVPLPESITSKVTLRHLLEHRAGFRDIFTPEYMENPKHYDTLDKKVGILASAPLLFFPGERYQYSNYGYILLGWVLEKVSGKSYAELLNERIIKPLALENTHLFYQAKKSHQSKRYTFTLEGRLRPVELMEVPGPDGGIEATALDLAQFYRALFASDRLLNRSRSPFQEFFGKRAGSWQSFGGGTGISAAVEWHPPHCVVVLANTDSLVAERLSRRIVQVLRNETSDPFRLPPKHFAYKEFLRLGREQFVSEFPQNYTAVGYSGFVGRAINEAIMDLCKQRSWAEATALCNALIDLYPNAPQPYDSLAHVLNAEGKSEQARAVFKRVRNIDSEFRSEYSVTDYQSQ